MNKVTNKQRKSEKLKKTKETSRDQLASQRARRKPVVKKYSRQVAAHYPWKKLTLSCRAQRLEKVVTKSCRAQRAETSGDKSLPANCQPRAQSDGHHFGNEGGDGGFWPSGRWASTSVTGEKHATLRNTSAKLDARASRRNFRCSSAASRLQISRHQASAAQTCLTTKPLEKLLDTDRVCRRSGLHHGPGELGLTVR